MNRNFRSTLIKLTVLAVFGLLLTAQTQFVAADSKGLAVGAKFDGFALADANGKQQKFDGLKGKNGTVIIFLSTQCPVVNKFYKERIAQISKDYAAKGFNFIGLNANSTETAEQIKANATERGYAFPVLIDKKNVVADQLGAQVTPEVFVFDKQNTLVYRGGIDNDREGKNITAHYLTDALDATANGKAIAKTETQSFGCGIKRAN